MNTRCVRLRWSGWLCLAAFAVAPLVAVAADSEAGPAIAARISTLGIGLEFAVPLAPDRLNVRFAGTMGGLNYTDTQRDLDYEVEARLRTGAALLDWHPGGGGFRFSFGAMYNGNTLDGTARPLAPAKIGNVRFTPEQIGTLRAAVDFPALAGYFGIGFGNAAGSGSRWTVLFDLGVMFHSAPDFQLSADGTLADEPLFRAELERERAEIETDYVRLARYYPVVSFGLGYRF